MSIDDLCNGTYMERVAGIEPASLAWKAKVLPLNYSRISGISGCHEDTQYPRFLVERAGFEPAKSKTPELQSGPVGRLGNLS